MPPKVNHEEIVKAKECQRRGGGGIALVQRLAKFGWLQVGPYSTVRGDLQSHFAPVLN